MNTGRELLSTLSRTLATPVQAPAGRGRPSPPNKSRPIGSEYLAAPKGGIAPFLEDSRLLPKRPPVAARGRR